LKGLLPGISVFHGRGSLSLFQILPLSSIDGTNVPLERKPSMFAAAASNICFPLRIQLVFKKNMSCKSEFSRGE
jgi:hypothetical protein